MQRKLALSEVLFAGAFLLLLMRLGIGLVDYLRLTAATLFFPFPLDYGEGPILDQTMRLVHFENIYRNDLSTPPYTISNYPPLFHLIQIPFAWIFGPAFWYGRLISILSAVATIILIGWMVYTLTGDRVASMVSGLVPLSFPYLAQWSVYNRVDTLALALSLCGIFMIIRWTDNRNALLTSGLVFTAAAYTRQSYILAAPFTAIVWLLLTRHRQQAYKLLAIVSVSSLGLFLLLNLLTQGGFYLNIFRANLNPFSWYTVTNYLVDIYTHAGYLVIGAILFMIVERLGNPTRSWLLVAPYSFGAALAAITVGKAGSGINYMYEIVIALSLTTGALIAWTGENFWLKASIIFVLVMQVNSLHEWSRQEYFPNIMEKVSDIREISQMAEIMQNSQDPVLADEFMGLLPLYKRRLYFQPFEYKQLAEGNLWNQEGILTSIRNKEFSVILLYQPRTWNAIIERWTPEMRNTIYEYYTLEKTLANTFVYLPDR